MTSSGFGLFTGWAGFTSLTGEVYVFCESSVSFFAGFVKVDPNFFGSAASTFLSLESSETFFSSFAFATGFTTLVVFSAGFSFISVFSASFVYGFFAGSDLGFGNSVTGGKRSKLSYPFYTNLNNLGKLKAFFLASASEIYALILPDSKRSLKH